MAVSSGLKDLGRWSEVDLLDSGFDRLAAILAVDPAGADDATLDKLSAEEHAAMAWMMRDTVHLNWTQEHSLRTWNDALGECEDEVVSGHTFLDSLSGDMATQAAALTTDVEKRAFALRGRLGRVDRAWRGLPEITLGAVTLTGIARLTDMAPLPIPVDWLRELGTRVGFDLAGLGEPASAAGLFALLRLSLVLTPKAAKALRASRRFTRRRRRSARRRKRRATRASQSTRSARRSTPP